VTSCIEKIHYVCLRACVFARVRWIVVTHGRVVKSRGLQAWHTYVLWLGEVKTVEWMSCHAECSRTLAAWRCVAGAENAARTRNTLDDNDHRHGAGQEGAEASNEGQEASDFQRAHPGCGVLDSSGRAGTTGMTTKMMHVMRHDDDDDLYELVDDEDFEPLALHHSPSGSVLDRGVGNRLSSQIAMGARESYVEEGGGDAGEGVGGGLVESAQWQQALEQALKKEVERVRHQCQQDLLQVCCPSSLLAECVPTTCLAVSVPVTCLAVSVPVTCLAVSVPVTCLAVTPSRALSCHVFAR
jgi:hypothetical protein